MKKVFALLETPFMYGLFSMEIKFLDWKGTKINLHKIPEFQPSGENEST